MKSKHVIIQIGFVAIAIPLLTLLFHCLAQEIAPIFHSGVVNYLETGTGMGQYQLQKYRQFSLNYNKPPLVPLDMSYCNVQNATKGDSQNEIHATAGSGNRRRICIRR